MLIPFLMRCSHPLGAGLLDAEDGEKCKELDQALTALETQLKAKAEAMDQFAAMFGKSKLDRAAARVRAAGRE